MPCQARDLAESSEYIELNVSRRLSSVSTKLTDVDLVDVWDNKILLLLNSAIRAQDLKREDAISFTKHFLGLAEQLTIAQDADTLLTLTRNYFLEKEQISRLSDFFCAFSLKQLLLFPKVFLEYEEQTDSKVEYKDYNRTAMYIQKLGEVKIVTIFELFEECKKDKALTQTREKFRELMSNAVPIFQYKKEKSKETDSQQLLKAKSKTLSNTKKK